MTVGCSLNCLPPSLTLACGRQTLCSSAQTYMNKAYGEANSIAQQALASIRTVYAFNGEQRTLDAYSASLEQPVKVGGCARGGAQGPLEPLAAAAAARP